jgi:microcystin-dependent protein
MGTTYGNGDGSTTFNLPDKTGRVSVMKEATATRLTTTYFGGDSTQLGSVGTSSEKHTLTASELPAHSHPNILNDPGHSHGGGQASQQNGAGGTNGGITQSWFSGALNTNSATTGITISNANNTGGGNPHAIVQPTIVCNYIIRIV